MWSDKKIASALLSGGKVRSTPNPVGETVDIIIGKAKHTVKCKKWKLLNACINEAAANGIGRAF